MQNLLRKYYEKILLLDHINFREDYPGVSQAALPKLFERLYREEQLRNRALGGSGLGLSICEAIVKAHGGTIMAQPSALGGLCIQIELPLVNL